MWNGKEQLGLLSQGEAHEDEGFMTGAKLQTLANLGTNMARELLETRPTFWHGVSDHRNFRFPSSPIEICKSQGNALKLLICSGFGFCGFFPDTLRWFDLSPVQLCWQSRQEVAGGTSGVSSPWVFPGLSSLPLQLCSNRGFPLWFFFFNALPGAGLS